VRVAPHLVDREPLGHVVDREVSSDRAVPARDVETDSDYRDVVAVRRDTADGHHVADVPVREDSGALSLLGHV